MLIIYHHCINFIVTSICTVSHDATFHCAEMIIDTKVTKIILIINNLSLFSSKVVTMFDLTKKQAVAFGVWKLVITFDIL